MSDPATATATATAKGKLPRLTDADLEAMAEVTPDDVDEAVDFWKRHAPQEYRNLPDATTNEPGGD